MGCPRRRPKRGTRSSGRDPLAGARSAAMVEGDTAGWSTRVNSTPPTAPLPSLMSPLMAPLLAPLITPRPHCREVVWPRRQRGFTTNAAGRITRARISSAPAPNTTVTVPHGPVNNPISVSKNVSPRYRNRALGEPMRREFRRRRSAPRRPSERRSRAR